ncbi:50S ribosomal protein L32e [Candidatus Woesearchaeota archaeon]|nr:50S ribosomal protein L32e [Candidatus Woesearchaeota archaeon]
MKSMQQLLELRKKIKENKPEFIRQEYPARKKLEKIWRKPKGIHSKMREKKLGKRKQPSVGYKSPRMVRGLSREGLIPILVYTLNDLVKVTKNNIVIIGKNVGNKKRIELLKKIKEKGFKIQNIKNIDEKIRSLTQEFEKRIKEKKERLNAKEKKPEKKPEVKEEKTETEEEKKKREQEEKRKVLEGKK